MSIFELLEKICRQLDQHKIDYMLSGSVAMNTYTTPRMTRDIDVVINLFLRDIDNFLSIFKEGYYINSESVKQGILSRGMFNVIDEESGLKIDFIVRKNTEYHHTEFSRRKQNNTYGFNIWIVSIEDLILAKIGWIQQLQSTTQLDDLNNLLSVPNIDMEYIKKWCKELNYNTFNLFLL